MNPIPQPKPSAKPPTFRAARQTAEESTYPRLHRQERPKKPPATLTLSPLAWLKLLMFLHAGDGEIGGFGISSPGNPLYIEDFITVKQAVTSVTVAFDDAAVADYFDDCIDRGIPPARCARVWVHTHPGQSPHPSSVDEETFARVFRPCDWAIMLIVSRTHCTYARISFSAGPGGAILVPVNVDWAAWPELLLECGADLGEIAVGWMDEYGRNIHPIHPIPFRDIASMVADAPSAIRAPKAHNEWLEDDIYAAHENARLDAEFADVYENSAWEDR